ncbi:MAG: M20/M25/M40 family metallo-hydrolase [Phycisphaerae bacterium]|nr:M20/M25/M40 family metallo-hydrolase [Phycisphaerae bacterium]
MIPPTLTAATCALLLASASAAAPPAPKDVMAAISQDYVRTAVDTLAAFGTRHSLSDATSPTRGIGAARNWLKGQFESFNPPSGTLTVHFEEFQPPVGGRIAKPVTFVNVVAVLPGTMPESAHRRIYVVGHYDSMPSDVMDPDSDAPGANDDGSGTVAVLAIARALAATPCEATVVFLCTAGEEQGLIGAKYHAEQAAARKESITAVLSNDIVGDPWGPGGDKSRATPYAIRLFSEGIPRNPSAAQLQTIRALAAESDSPSRQLARYVAEVAAIEDTVVRPMLVFRLDRFLRGGDHSAFNEAGFAAVRFTEVDEDYRHQHQTPRLEPGPDGTPVQYGDLPEHVDAEYLANVARLNAAALVHLANAPAAPAAARIITAKLEYTTTLRWSANREPDVAGYEVVWRQTTDAVWTGVKDVGNVTEATIDQNKDNVFFGIRAYDCHGYRSLVAFPAAARD